MSNETKWTPRPWVIDRTWSSLTIESAGAEVCDVSAEIEGDKEGFSWNLAPTEEQMANANLIAAAPELYDALDNLLRDLSEPMDKATTEYFIKEAVATLAKARGEQ